MCVYGLIAQISQSASYMESKWEVQLYYRVSMLGNQADDLTLEGTVRRSGRCRTVNSIYAESIGDLKNPSKLKSNLPTRRLPRRPSFGEDQDSLDYQARCNVQKVDETHQYLKAEIKCEDGSYKTIEVMIQMPKRTERRSTRVIKPPTQIKKQPSMQAIIKRKPSPFKSTKDLSREEPKSLLNIMLNAALKVKEQQQDSLDDLDPHGNLNNDSSESMHDSDEAGRKPKESRQTIRGIQKDQASRKLVKMDMRFQNLRKRYQQIRPKMLQLFN